MANLDFKIKKRIKESCKKDAQVANIKEQQRTEKKNSEIRVDRYTPSLNQHHVEEIHF
jgi:hypothetical protein